MRRDLPTLGLALRQIRTQRGRPRISEPWRVRVAALGPASRTREPGASELDGGSGRVSALASTLSLGEEQVTIALADRLGFDYK